MLLTNANLNAGQRLTHRGRVVAVQRDDGNHGRGFRHAIALQQRYIQRQKGAGRALRNSGATRNRHAHAAAKHLGDLLAELRMRSGCRRANQRRIVLVQIGNVLTRAEVGPAPLHRSFKGLTLFLGARQNFLQHLGVHALINAGHADKDGGLFGLHVLHQQGGRACIGRAGTAGNGQVVAHGALKGVRERQKGQKAVVLTRVHALGKV